MQAAIAAGLDRTVSQGGRSPGSRASNGRAPDREIPTVAIEMGVEREKPALRLDEVWPADTIAHFTGKHPRSTSVRQVDTLMIPRYQFKMKDLQEDPADAVAQENRLMLLATVGEVCRWDQMPGASTE